MKTTLNQYTMNTRKTIRTGLLLALLSASTISSRADSGAPNRSKAFGYEFTQEELESFPQKTNLPTVYLQIYKTDYDATTDKSTIRLNDSGEAELEDLGYIFDDNKKHDWYYRSQIIIRDDWAPSRSATSGSACADEETPLGI